MPPLAAVSVSSALGAVAVTATVSDWPKVLGTASYMIADWPRLFGAFSFVVFFIIQIAVWAGWYMFIYPFWISPLRHLPTPPGSLPLIGHSYSALVKGVGVSARYWISRIQNEGFIRMIGPFHREYILITSPQALSEVLVSKAYDFEKPKFIRNAFGPFLGHGLVLAEGQEHKVQRRSLMPAFSFRHIKDLYPTFWRKSCDVVKAMMETCDAQGQAEFDVDHWAGRVSLDIIGVAGLGRDFDAVHNEHDEIVKTYMIIATPSAQDRILLVLTDFFGSFLPMPLLLKVPIPRVLEARRAARTIRNVCKDLIQAKKKKLQEDKLDDLDILSQALKSGMFDEEMLINHLMTFLGAGHETTASALTFAIYALCRHPEVQTRLRDEVRQNLPSVNEDREITSNDIDSLPYLNAVCNEVLRMHSPVPQTIREAIRDTTVHGQVVPRGTRFILAAWGTNIDRSLWGDDGEEFRPERWLVDADAGAESIKAASLGGATSNYAFLSFLHGPRSCIGQAFAKAEFACLLAAWVGKFSFELRDKSLMDESNMVFEQLITVKAAQGVHVRATVVPGF